MATLEWLVVAIALCLIALLVVAYLSDLEPIEAVELVAELLD